MGGKAFKDHLGNNPASRIPTENIEELKNRVLNYFALCFEKIEMVTSPNLFNKQDHGDLDFVVIGNKDNLRKKSEVLNNSLPDYFYSHPVYQKAFKTFCNGNMEHLLFPWISEDKVDLYQIDFIYCRDELQYQTSKFFYEQPSSFNSLIGQFARSLGYKFSTEGLLLHITDKRKENYYILMHRELSVIMKLLCLEMPNFDHIYSRAQNFADWLTSSPRYDSELMKKNFNMNSHRDARREKFCQDVYNILDKQNIQASIPPTKINFSQENFDLNETLKFERNILGDEIADKVLAECEKRRLIVEPIMSGDILLEMGFSGKIIGEILQDVSKKFSAQDELEMIKKYVSENYHV